MLVGDVKGESDVEGEREEELFGTF